MRRRRRSNREPALSHTQALQECPHPLPQVIPQHPSTVAQPGAPMVASPPPHLTLTPTLGVRRAYGVGTPTLTSGWKQITSSLRAGLK